MKIDVHSHIIDREYMDELQRFERLTPVRESSGKTLLRKGDHTYM